MAGKIRLICSKFLLLRTRHGGAIFTDHFVTYEWLRTSIDRKNALAMARSRYAE